MPQESRVPGAPPARRSVGHRARPWLRGWALLQRAGAGLVAGTFVLCLALSLLPLATIVLMGRVLYLIPLTFAQETADSAWEQLLLTLSLAIGTLVAQQVLAPLQAGLLETIGRREIGRAHV